MEFSETSIGLLSLIGVATIRLIIWIPITRKLLKRPLFRELAFPLKEGWWAHFLVGAGLTSLVLGLVFVMSVKVGWLTIDAWMWERLPVGDLFNQVVISLLITGSVAVIEEVIFRAYLLTGLRIAWGKTMGLGIMAVSFVIIHIPLLKGNPSLVIALAFLFILAFGVLFGLTYIHTDSLWLPVEIHFAWDFVESDLLNLSGDMANPHVIGAITRLEGPSSLGGLGNAILLDTLALALISAGIWFWLKIRKMQHLTPDPADA